MIKQKIAWSTHQFQQLEKKIITEEDLEVFKKTHLVQEILHFISKMAESVTSKPISATKPIKKFELIDQFFINLEKALDEVEPIQQQMRYGNKAFRDWLDKIQPIIHEYLAKQLPANQKGAEIELNGYLSDCFGNKQRIDYGTGHEFNFILFLMCLYKLEIFDDKDFEHVTRQAFYRYINFARKMQLRYMLEPAGSHGVWGLDDYQFMPFLFGAAELIKNEKGLLPEVIVKDTVLQNHKQEYMFFQCIDFINQVKKGPFSEHSPILYSLVNLTLWEKVVQGLSKMFQGEVLFKHPVIKHTLFGSLIEFK